MSLEDLEPQQPKQRGFEPLKLDNLAIKELREYIDQLKAEIERVEADIVGKQSLLGAAEQLFKS